MPNHNALRGLSVAFREVCIAARDFGPGRAQEGDVIVIREPKSGIGLKEGREFIWLLVDTQNLRDIVSENDLRGSSAKYRYNVDTSALGVDLNRMRDRRDWYQPFRDTNNLNGLHGRDDLKQSPTIVDKDA